MKFSSVVLLILFCCCNERPIRNDPPPQAAGLPSQTVYKAQSFTLPQNAAVPEFEVQAYFVNERENFLCSTEPDFYRFSTGNGCQLFLVHRSKADVRVAPDTELSIQPINSPGGLLCHIRKGEVFMSIKKPGFTLKFTDTSFAPDSPVVVVLKGPCKMDYRNYADEPYATLFGAEEGKATEVLVNQKAYTLKNDEAVRINKRSGKIERIKADYYDIRWKEGIVGGKSLAEFFKAIQRYYDKEIVFDGIDPARKYFMSIRLSDTLEKTLNNIGRLINMDIQVGADTIRVKKSNQLY